MRGSDVVARGRLGWLGKESGSRLPARIPHPFAMRLRKDGAPGFVVGFDFVGLYGCIDYGWEEVWVEKRFLHCATDGDAVCYFGRNDDFVAGLWI